MWCGSLLVYLAVVWDKASIRLICKPCMDTIFRSLIRRSGSTKREMRKQVEQLNGCFILTGQETPGTNRDLDENNKCVFFSTRKRNQRET